MYECFVCLAMYLSDGRCRRTEGGGSARAVLVYLGKVAIAGAALSRHLNGKRARVGQRYGGLMHSGGWPRLCQATCQLLHGDRCFVALVGKAEEHEGEKDKEQERRGDQEKETKRSAPRAAGRALPPWR